MTATNAEGTSAASEPSAPITLALAIDGLSYRVIDGTQTVEVTGRAPGNTDADITVPESIIHGGTSYRVARIRDRAFEVTPDENPNANNNGLEKATTRLASRDAPAINGLASLTIADSVEMIGAYAFAGNALTRLTLPEGVSTIKTHAFRNNRLTEVEFLGNFGDFSKDMFDDNPTLSTITYECSKSTGWPQAFNNGVDEVDARATNCDEVVESATHPSSAHSVPTLSIGPLFFLLSLMLGIGLRRHRRHL
ncbi:MAG: leucine-rich repeat protein [Wenzhouxiangella sp.]|nr:leucine-rich repeat protein [Wenzhouxiangella sp.]